MELKCSRIAVLFYALFALSAPGCGSQSKSWHQKDVSAERTDSASGGALPRPARWILLPEYTRDTELGDSPNHLLVDRIRVETAPNGSVRRGAEAIPVDDVKVLPLPPRLGGGYLFYGERDGATLIWRTEDWTSPLQPVAQLTESLGNLAPGFDRLYVTLSLSQRIFALDLKTGELVDNTPRPPAARFSSIAIASPWFGAVTTEVRGVLVTFDAGLSWQQLPLDDLHAFTSLVNGKIIVRSGSGKYQLTPLGELVPFVSDRGEALFREHNSALFAEVTEEDKADLPQNLVPKPLGPRPLREAVLRGWPLEDGTALATNRGALGKVRLADGELLQVTPNAYPGSEPCVAVALEYGAGFVCSERARGTQIYRWRAPLSLELVSSFSTPRIVTSNGRGALAIKGSCQDSVEEPAGSNAEPKDSQVYCIRRKSGEMGEIRVRGDVGVERVIPLDNDKVAVLIPPRLGTGGVLNLIGDGETKQVQLKLPKAKGEQHVLKKGTWLNGVTQLDDNTLGCWVVTAKNYLGVHIQLDGKVTAFPNENAVLNNAMFHGPIAFEPTDMGFTRESADFGKSWKQLDAPAQLTLVDDRKGTWISRQVGCSRVGCAYGAWLRVGFANSPDMADAGTQDTDLVSEARLPPSINPNPSSYPEWEFDCFPSGQQRRANDHQLRQLRLPGKAVPRRSLASGFGGAQLLTAPLSPGEERSVPFKAIEDVPAPNIPKNTVHFSAGSDHRLRFQGYAWGFPGKQWNSSGSWLVRVASPFGLDGLWGTSLTASPWQSAGAAAASFGLAQPPGTSFEWDLTLSAEGHQGLLRIGSRGMTELHILEEAQPIKSFAGLSVGKLAGAVKVDGKWYFGQRDGSLLKIFEVDGSSVQAVTTFNVGATNRAEVIGDQTGSHLGLLVRPNYGPWFIYPLTERFEAEAPLHLTREELNASPELCETERTGFRVDAPLPLTRNGGSDSMRMLNLMGDAERWRARKVAAQIIVDSDGFCVSALGAEVRDGSPINPVAVTEGLPTQSVPMTLTLLSPPARRVAFRCGISNSR